MGHVSHIMGHVSLVMGHGIDLIILLRLLLLLVAGLLWTWSVVWLV